MGNTDGQRLGIRKKHLWGTYHVPGSVLQFICTLIVTSIPYNNPVPYHIIIFLLHIKKQKRGGK